MRASQLVPSSSSGWGRLYGIGAVAAVLLVLIPLAQLVVFALAPPPSTAGEWFALFQRSEVLGLLAFELLMIVYVLVSIPLSLALSAALWRSNPSFIALYLGLTVVGVTAWITARPAFEMLQLSEQYTAATHELQRASLLAVGEGLLATFHGTAFYVSYLLGSLGGFLVSVVMLQSGVFGRAAAYLRMTSSALDLGLFLPGVGLFVSLGSVFALLAFNVLVARRLFQLSRVAAPIEESPWMRR